MSGKTVKVSNVSLGASERDIQEFFSFSGDIEYVEMKSDTERSQIAYVTFKDAQGAETAVLLSGATIVDLSVTITLDPDYQLPPAAFAKATQNKAPGGAESALQKSEDVVSSMLAKGFILGKDAVSKAKTFDEKHQLSSTASAKVASFDKKIGFTDKISAGSAVVGGKVREVDQKFQVSEKTKSAFAAAEQSVSNAGSAIMKNRYVLTGATWVTGAFNKVAKAAGDVSQKAKEKVGKAEEEERRNIVDEYAQTHLSDSPVKASEASERKPSSGPAPAQVRCSSMEGTYRMPSRSAVSNLSDTCTNSHFPLSFCLFFPLRSKGKMECLQFEKSSARSLSSLRTSLFDALVVEECGRARLPVGALCLFMTNTNGLQLVGDKQQGRVRKLQV